MLSVCLTTPIIETTLTPTNKITVKPNFSKSKPLPVPADENDEICEVAETQVKTDMDGDDFDISEDEGSDYASDASHSQKKAVVQMKNKANEASTQQVSESKPNEDGPVRAAARKIKATAHANFRRLKIKSKAGNGGKGRFGRRR